MASVLTALTFGFSACEKDKTDVAPTATEDPTLKRLLAMGFDKKNIEDKGAYYLVEGDIRFDKQAAGTTPATQPGVVAQSQDQSHSWSLISYDKQPNITYRIDSPSLPSNAIQDAVNEWNSVQGCRVKLTPTSGSADIVFTSQNLPTGVLGQGSFPNNGAPGSYVYIDTNQIGSASSGTLKLVLVHELGHVFGFRHTDWVANWENESNNQGTGNGNGAVVITGTPATDANSVMNSGGAPNHGPNAVWVGFSANDIIGFQNLYPIYATNIGSGYYRIINRISGRILDVNGGNSSTRNGDPIVLWQYGGYASQQWSFVSSGNDHFSIVNRSSGKILDVSGGNSSTSDRVPIVQWQYGGYASQQWRIQDVGGGYYKIVNRNTAKGLDVSGGNSNDSNGAQIVQWPYGGNNSQQWRIEPI